MCRRAIPHSARRSTSAKRNSPTSVSGPSTFSTKKISAWLARDTPHAAGAAGVAGARGVAGAVARPWPVAPDAGAAGVAQSAVAEPVELAQAVQAAAALVALPGALAASFARSAFSIALTDPTRRYQGCRRMAALPAWLHGGSAVAIRKSITAGNLKVRRASAGSWKLHVLIS